MSKKILIVDDESTVRNLLTRALSDGDYAISTAADGLQAQELCRQLPYDLLITDNEMPKRTGVQIIPQIRMRRPDTKIILMSGGEIEEKEALKIGADAFLAKPIKIDEFFRVVTNLIGG